MRMKRMRERRRLQDRMNESINPQTSTPRGEVRHRSEINPKDHQRGDNCPPSSLTPNVASNSTPNLSRTALSDSTRLEIWESAIN